MNPFNSGGFERKYTLVFCYPSPSTAPQPQFPHMNTSEGAVDRAPDQVGCYTIPAGTAMSNLPCEMLDHIVDLLHDSQTYGQVPLELRNCCLVSKSWVPRTRRHLFANIYFDTAKNLESWKRTFPGPSISPACYAKRLCIGRPQVVTAEGAEAGGWIASFSSVEHLELGGQDTQARGWEVAFALFHRFSPVVKSIRMNASILPFPHLLRHADQQWR